MAAPPHDHRTVAPALGEEHARPSDVRPADAGANVRAPVPTRERPGSAARRLLGGDDAVHVFATRAEAVAYEMRMPGASTLSARRGGWSRCARERGAGALVRDRVVIIELRADASETEKAEVRELGAAFYRLGAVEVRCWGRIVRDQRSRAA